MLFLGILSIQCKIRRNRSVGHPWFIHTWYFAWKKLVQRIFGTEEENWKL